MNENKLQHIRKNKLNQKIKYLKLELEETNLIFQDCLAQFYRDFSEYEKEKSKKSSFKREVEFDIPKERIKSIFRRISLHTHPDALIKKKFSKEKHDERVKLYKKANNAQTKNDLDELMKIAEELEIEIPKEDDIPYLEEMVQTIVTKIQEIQKTYAWIWRHTEEDSKELLKEKIIETLGK